MGLEHLVAIEVGLCWYYNTFTCQKERLNGVFLGHFLPFLWFEKHVWYCCYAGFDGSYLV